MHARGSGAHGYFQVGARADDYRGLLQIRGRRRRCLPAFRRRRRRFRDLPRRWRLAVKSTPRKANSIWKQYPVFIQDAIGFPDLIHSVKMEPDRGFPQAGSAHDTFWDFMTLMPESMHMLMGDVRPRDTAVAR